MSNKDSVGFVGIGTMGWPMAINIAKAGFPLTVFDSDPQIVSSFCEEYEASAASGMADIAACDIVITMLPTGPVVQAVLLNADSGAFISSAQRGTIVIDMSSSEPTGTQNLGKILAEKNITLIDAPVSGAVQRATTGTLTIMIGGDSKSAIEAVKPVLLAMGERLFETGGSGSGHAVKALNNFIASTAYAATAEAVLIAKRFGLDPETLIDVVNVSTGKSFISDIVMKDHVLDEKFGTGFALGLLTKDVRIAAELGEEVKLDAPVSRLMRDRWASAQEKLGFGADHTEAIKSWEENL